MSSDTFSRAKESIHQNPSDKQKGRDLIELEKMLGFNRESMHGKIILDLGSSTHAKFATDLEQAGVKAKVISLSPAYANEKDRNIVKEADPQGSHVAALGEHLPFNNESFNVVISAHVLEHLESRHDFLEFVKEIIRVLKKGGTAYIGETFPDDSQGTTYSMDLQAKDLDNETAKNITVSKERYRKFVVRDHYGEYLRDDFTGRIIIHKD